MLKITSDRVAGPCPDRSRTGGAGKGRHAERGRRADASCFAARTAQAQVALIVEKSHPFGRARWPRETLHRKLGTPKIVLQLTLKAKMKKFSMTPGFRPRKKLSVPSPVLPKALTVANSDRLTETSE